MVLLIVFAQSFRGTRDSLVFKFKSNIKIAPHAKYDFYVQLDTKKVTYIFKGVNH